MSFMNRVGNWVLAGQTQSAATVIYVGVRPWGGPAGS